jgi:hypothetical protein
MQKKTFKNDAEGSSAFKRALLGYSENYLGSTTIEVRKTDFFLFDFFIQEALKDHTEAELQTFKHFLKVILNIYKMDYGLHPKYAKETSKKKRKDVQFYTEKEVSEHIKAEPWQCFLNTNNNLDVFILMSPARIGTKQFNLNFYSILAALAIRDTPKTPENYKSIVIATNALAAFMYATNGMTYKSDIKLLEQMKPALTQKEKLNARAKKGASASAVVRQQKAEKKKLQVFLFIKSLPNAEKTKGLVGKIIDTQKVSKSRAELYIKQYKENFFS